MREVKQSGRSNSTMGMHVNQYERDCERARLNRLDIINAKLSRREMFKYGLLTAGGMLVAKSGLSIRAAGAGTLVSPPTRAWAEPLPIPRPLQPTLDISSLTASSSSDPREVKRPDHQAWAECPPVEGYELRQE